MNIKKLAKLFALIPLPLALVQTASAVEITVLEDRLKAVGIQDAARDFEKQTGIKVNVIETHTYVYTIEKLRLDGPAGTAPDMMVLPHDQVSIAAQEGLISPLDLNKAEKSKFLPSALDAVTYKGQVYAIPKTVENLVVLYNKNYIKKPFETLEDYTNYSEEVWEKTDGGSYGFVAKLDELYFAYPIIKAFGGYVFGRNEEGRYNIDDFGLNNQASLDAVNYMKNLNDHYHIPFDTKGKHETIFNMLDYFLSTNAHSIITGPWDIRACMDKGVKFGVAALPKLPNGKYMSGFNGVRAYVINKWSKNYDACRQFAMFLNQPKYAKIRFDLTGAPPALAITKDDPELFDNEIIKAIYTQFDRNEYMPNIPEMAQVWLPYSAMLGQIYNNEAQIKSGLDFVTSKIKQSIKDYRLENNL